MKYTAGELRQMNWRKCKLQYWDKPEAEGEIYVVDWSVSFVTNALPYKGDWEKKKWYKYTWALYYDFRTDKYIDYSISITFIDEPHQNIYYDDNGLPTFYFFIPKRNEIASKRNYRTGSSSEPSLL